jgi:hypothetical protein
MIPGSRPLRSHSQINALEDLAVPGLNLPSVNRELGADAVAICKCSCDRASNVIQQTGGGAENENTVPTVLESPIIGSKVGH